jgi:hypothetical protein
MPKCLGGPTITTWSKETRLPPNCDHSRSWREAFEEMHAGKIVKGVLEP